MQSEEIIVTNKKKSKEKKTRSVYLNKSRSMCHQRRSLLQTSVVGKILKKKKKIKVLKQIKVTLQSEEEISVTSI